MKKQSNIRVYYAWATYGKEERDAVNAVLQHPETLVGGEYTKEFETKVAAIFGKKHGVMVNSGSSANLLAFEILNLPKGSEVITPVLTFSTTVAPLVQKGIMPFFVDVEEGTYLVDINQLEDAITKKTKALMIPSLLGNVPDYSRLLKIAEENNLWLVEDSCDTLVAKINGIPTGKFSHISTTSFYSSHIITALGGGGMICVNDDDQMRKLKILRGWGRSSAVDESMTLEERFSQKIYGIQYDSKFIFEAVGYNFLPLEASAAFGVAQLNKLPQFQQMRKQNFKELVDFSAQYKEFFILPRQAENVETTWLGLPMTLKEGAPFTRLDIVKHLETNGIQTRPVFTGNILKQPGFKNIDCKRFSHDFPIADHVMRSSFVIGVHQGLRREHLEHVKSVLSNFLNKF